jgi:hypothetical protein
MAKINDGGKSAGETLSSLKSMYQNRERESEVKHKQELSEIQKAHAVELDRVRNEANDRVKVVQNESNVKLNQRDMQFQKEAENIRATYQRQVAQAKKESIE